MRLHRFDWLILVVAAAAITWGVVVNPSVGYSATGNPPGADWRFPWELTSGIAVGLVALAVVGVRRIGRST